MPQTPLGQFDVLLHVSYFSGGPFLPVAVFQTGADQVDVGGLDANLAIAQIDHVQPGCLSDPSFDGLAVAEDEYPLAGWSGWRGLVRGMKY